MFKTKGFSSNNSLKRRAIIVDAPDLPPEEAEFYITSVGIADTEKGDVSEAKGLDFEVEELYEEEESEEAEETEKVSSREDASDLEEYALIDVKGIGDGTIKNLAKNGIKSVRDLLSTDPEALATKISGISSKMVSEWQTNARALINA
jgi:hypothetical protein